MTTQNDFLTFAAGGGANVVSQATYAALSAIANGYASGLASSNQLNKTWRQSSIMANILGQLIIQQINQPVIDDGTTATILANLTLALQSVSGGVNTSNFSLVTTGGATTLSATQAANAFVTVTGVLASDATVNFPVGPQRWGIVNNTTGAHTLTCKTSAGTGVVVTQGHTDTIQSDGTNVVFATFDVLTRSLNDNSTAAASTAYADRAVAAVGGYYQDTGGVANAYIIAPIPALTGSYVSGTSFRIRTTRTGSGASTLDAGLGAKALVLENGNPTASGDIHGLFTVTYDSTVGAGSWILNGEALSELGACAKLNIGAGLINDGLGNLAATGIAGQGAYTTTNGTGAPGWYQIDTSGGPFTFTLEGSPVQGDNYTFTDATASWAANNFTVNPNGSTFDFAPGNFVCDTVGSETFTVIYKSGIWSLQ